MTGGEGAAEAQLSRQHGRRDDASEPSRIVAGTGGVRAPNAKHVERGTLRLEQGPTTDGAHLDGRHGHVDLEVAVEPRKKVPS